MATDDSPQASLLSLPREIRDQIYDFLFEDDCVLPASFPPVSTCANTSTAAADSPRPVVLRIRRRHPSASGRIRDPWIFPLEPPFWLATCSQIFLEAREHFARGPDVEYFYEGQSFFHRTSKHSWTTSLPPAAQPCRFYIDVMVSLVNDGKPTDLEENARFWIDMLVGIMVGSKRRFERICISEHVKTWYRIKADQEKRFIKRLLGIFQGVEVKRWEITFEGDTRLWIGMRDVKGSDNEKLEMVWSRHDRGEMCSIDLNA